MKGKLIPLRLNELLGVLYATNVLCAYDGLWLLMIEFVERSTKTR